MWLETGEVSCVGDEDGISDYLSTDISGLEIPESSRIRGSLKHSIRKSPNEGKKEK